MARLPIPGSDSGVWGAVLNEFLSTSHNPDGSLKPSAQSVPDASITTQQLADNSVTNAKLDATIQTSLATLNSKYTKPAGGIPTGDLSSSVQTSLSNADSALQLAPVASVNAKIGAVTIDKADIGLADVDNTNDAAKPVSSAQLAALSDKVDVADPRLADARTPLAHTQAASTISDSTSTGRAVLTAADATAARTAIGAGTSSLALGTTSTTAAAGDDSRIVNALDTTTASATYMMVVDHGAVASTARPAGALAVYWIGAVEPTNATDGDLWTGAL